ncbi:MAG: hypothetical protein AAFX02_06280 [Pseudomonadota bacterium]
MIQKFFNAMETMTRIFDIIVYIAAALLGGWIAFSIVGLMEYGLLAQIGAALLGAIVGAAIGWVAWKIMQVFA